MNGANARTLGVASALIVGIAYGLGGAINQIVCRNGISVIHLTIYQFIAAAVILGILTLLFFRECPPKKTILQLSGLGILCIGASLCYFLAIDYLSVGQAVAIQFQYVWIAIAAQCILEKLTPNKAIVLSILLIIIGSILGSGLADEVLSGNGITLNAVGVLFGIACAVCQGLFIYLNSRVAVDTHPVPKTFFIVLAGLIVASFISPDFYTKPEQMVRFLPGGLVMGLVMSIVPCLCLAFSSARISSGLISVLTSVELPVAVLTGALLLGECQTVLTVCGVVLILASVIIAQVKGDFRKILSTGE